MDSLVELIHAPVDRMLRSQTCVAAVIFELNIIALPVIF